MGNELAVQESRAIAPVIEYSSEQVALLSNTIAKGCSEIEMKLFLQVAKIKRLDPFTGQIRPMKRWDSAMGRETMTVQTGIDGYRVIASRTGELAGSDDPIYDTEENEFPRWAKVTVYRWSNGQRIPYTATARWSEYVQIKKGKNGEPDRPNSMWTRMPYLMLGKVAEALALRKAFPDELSGIYTFEEMGQADNPDPHAAPSSRPPVQQPTRASEARQQPAATQQVQGTAQTQQPQVELEVISGVIQTAKFGTGDNGVLWMKVNDQLVRAAPDKQHEEMAEGNWLSAKVKKLVGEKIGTYYALEELLECKTIQEGEVQEGEVEEPAVNADGTKQYFDTGEAPAATTEAAPAAVETLVANGAVKPASSLPEGSGKKEGTIGIARAKRLYAIVSQNCKRTGYTQEVLKQNLAEHQLEHLRDLPVQHYEHFEKLANGTAPWKDDD